MNIQESWLSSSLVNIYNQGPGNKNSGVFVCDQTRKEEQMQSVDHTKLHNHIVQKAFDASSAVLTEEQKMRLFKNKIERAAEMLQARGEDCPVTNRRGLYSSWYR
jgi:hypothetical protein